MSYHSVGDRTRLGDSQAGTVTSTYDAANRLSSTTLTDGTNTMRVDPASLIGHGTQICCLR
jgi:YD repeat-containing protein